MPGAPGLPPRRTDPSTTLRAGSGAPGPRLQTNHSSTVMLSGESKHLRFVSQLHGQCTHQRCQSSIVSSLELRQEQPQILRLRPPRRTTLRMTVVGWDLCFPRFQNRDPSTSSEQALGHPAAARSFKRCHVERFFARNGVETSAVRLAAPCTIRSSKMSKQHRFQP